MIVRPAEPDDFNDVAALLAELGRPVLIPETREAARQVYLRHLARPDTDSHVAVAEGVVVGFISLEYRERLNRTRPQGWIPDLLVTKASLGTGAGKALLLRAFERAKEYGCYEVTLESGFQREVAHQVYAHVGMERLGYYFTKALDGM
jgi:GNAT superfamily N-acetyltransferase